MPAPLLSRRFLGVALVGLAVSACLSPTLPLPPPSRPTVEGPDAAGNVRLSGRVPGGATVSALNVRTDLIAGQQTGETGRYDFKIAAVPGDEIVFWYTQRNTNSPAVVLVIQEPESGAGGAGGAGD